MQLLPLLFALVAAEIKIQGSAEEKPVVKGGLGSLSIQGTVGKGLVFERDVGYNVVISGTIGNDVTFAGEIGDDVKIEGVIGSKTKFTGAFGTGCKFTGTADRGVTIIDTFPEKSTFAGHYLLDPKGNTVLEVQGSPVSSKHVQYVKSSGSPLNLATFAKAPGTGVVFQKPIGSGVQFKGLVGNNVIFKEKIGSNVVFECDIPSGTTLEMEYNEGWSVSKLDNVTKNTIYQGAPIDPKHKGTIAPPKKKGDNSSKDSKDGKTEGEETVKKQSKNAANSLKVSLFIPAILFILI